MGAAATKENLYEAIDAGDDLWITDILQRCPELANEPITGDGRSNAIVRAAILGKANLLLTLIKHGADVNVTGQSEVTGLMWAASKGNMECVKTLVEFGSDLTKTDPEGMNACDYAALYGYYAVLFYLVGKGGEVTKTAEEYAEIKAQGTRKIPYVDYPCLMMTLECKIPPEVAPFFTIPPPVQKVVLKDPVDDPRESWTEWQKRIIDFDFSAPKVERDSLPQDLQPQNTLIGRIKTYAGIESPLPELNQQKLDTDAREVEMRDISQQSISNMELVAEKENIQMVMVNSADRLEVPEDEKEKKVNEGSNSSGSVDSGNPMTDPNAEIVDEDEAEVIAQVEAPSEDEIRAIPS